MLTVISSFHSENSQMGKLELLIIENVAIPGSWSHNSLKTVWIPDLYRPARARCCCLFTAVGQRKGIREENCSQPPALMRNLHVGGLELAVSGEEDKEIARKCGVRLWH